jgi:predicted transposase/invertase (TIGR01784 family)
MKKTHESTYSTKKANETLHPINNTSKNESSCLAKMIPEDHPVVFSKELEAATGPIDYGFTNDYMFRVILQKNQRVLKSLICALLHMEEDFIQTLTVTNPIKLGEAIDEKTFMLDIAILMNNHSYVNLEMQVLNELNWQDRSLSYLCRSFDQLHAGQDYTEVGPAIHIGFLDFCPFPEYPEFYASYKLLNIKNHHVYSRKFVLNVIDLTHIHLACEEDKAYEIDYWARLFKATTWEELKMIAEKNPNLAEASESLYTMNADDLVRAKCRARDDYYRHQGAIQAKIEQLTTEKEQLTEEKTQIAAQYKEATVRAEQADARAEHLSLEVEVLKKILSENGISIPEDLKKL